ncbi:sulfate reduction electron transfer complex DsrMKJOP subunit DsrP [Rhodopirellula europaea]|jgi:molybdopterin-containing oxidoreductase family membrane subunit|uniref:Polysulfide reductase, NrfD n=1 Tax=Rhodopirellula europaea 6C TaxID=1263867 RepID=M2AST5_9BACT|nr:NrfD/PsrC family molybdoenzyme membrane anchor subunit [Rhodopirellula europaea]EMB15782.1 Polysulfide reductase, NrfD [Rhodopirellula europaea 6C]MCR9207240.1 polysulfide reductase NrfD [bacterium]|tara:strand:+ start:57390 stop:58655 length:1266 start_codon:yes stop_codon:yes gene_type:complete
MSSITAPPDITEPGDNESHITSYPKFIGRSLWLATEGSLAFYAWMTMLTALFLVGANAWANQVAGGMVGTNMTDQVSWGLYIANFTFMVGLAAGGVMMVIPAYLYHDRKMHDVVIIGELLAIAAIVMCLMFVVADLGRPDRFWHMMPVIGKFNWPISMLTWDVIVLNGYLVLNLHICGYLLYMRFLGRKPNPTWYIPFVMLSIVWAISIHTVTAFLYCGLGGRPFWNTALLAPRFLASAFVSGPAFIIVSMVLIKRLTGVGGLDHPIATLTKIIRVTILINLLMVASELFTEFYTGGSHVSAAKYLFFGLHGKTALVPWTWTAIALNISAALLFLWPGLLGFRWRPLLVTACVMAFVGAWIEKGMGLIVPGFIPSTLHEIVEYVPSQLEWKVTVGIWAFGLMVFTIAIKTALPTLKHPAEH